MVDFTSFCASNGLPVDFISTHHYPTDAFGKPGDDTETQLSKSTRSILREQTRAVRKQAGNLPVYYTEWCTSSNPRDPMHDDPYAAAFIVKTILEANGLVQGYSYWTFSDIFEENYFPSVPFQGGFGLLNIHGIAKPAYRAFQLLHGLGTELMQIDGAHETVDAWLVRGDGSATLMLTNFALPRHPIATESVNITVQGVVSIAEASIQRIDLDARQRQTPLGANGQARISQRRDRRRAGVRVRSPEGPAVFRSESGDVQFRRDDAAAIGRGNRIAILATMDGLAALSDDALLDRLQRGAFAYFKTYKNAENGLIADTSRAGSPCSIAVVGFALSCYPWRRKRLDVAQAGAALTLRTLRFFWNSPQGDQADATGYKGFFYHFLDMRTGRRVWQCELSLIDTTLLLAGMLTAAGYFDGAAMKARSATWPTRSTVASTGGGRRTAARPSRKAGSRNAAFFTTDGKAITRRPSSIFWASDRRRTRCNPPPLAAGP